MNTSTPHPTIRDVTARIVARSADSRAAYLDRTEAALSAGPGRGRLSCANFAHAFAAQPASDKRRALDPAAPNLGIVTAYNDMLSAHQPYEDMPRLLRDAAREAGATAQVAGGVPAMCDGVTQGRPGMELSLFSRDLIAMATAVALSHDAFDGVLALGICDKIVPGLVMGALAFGHLPALLVPAGPMESGISNREKARIRQAFAAGECDRATLLHSEMAAYHGPGTCTFYGTANSNQMLMEVMGLHLPGSAFVPPSSALRAALTRAAAHRLAESGPAGRAAAPIGRVVDARAVVNGMVGLLATGGSTNHTLHLPAMAAAAGIQITWDDFADLSAVVPLIARIYPNGSADVNAFHAAGGMAVVVRELLAAGLLHADVETIAGPGLGRYGREPWLDQGRLAWREAPAAMLAPDILRAHTDPFAAEGGLVVLDGNLGRAIAKRSAVQPSHWLTEAPARIFDTPEAMEQAFAAGELARDLVIVVRFQGPRANGMPELHNLSPALGHLQDRGHRVALVTDGRMSGASGKIPAAIHVTPEAESGGMLARLRDGDLLRLDLHAGRLEARLDPATLHARPPAPFTAPPPSGFGREYFTALRRQVGPADRGASAIL